MDTGLSVWRCLEESLATAGPGAGFIVPERDGGFWSYPDFYRRCVNVSEWIGSHADPGDRLVVLCQSSHLQCLVSFAASRVGVVVVPLNAKWSRQEWCYGIQDCRPNALVHDDLLTDSDADEMCSSSTFRVPMRGDVRTLIAINHPAHLHAPLASPYGDAPFAIFYTSGTTSKPKGVVLSHTNMVVQARAKCDYVGYNSATVYLHLAPLYHVGGANSALAVALAGGTHISLGPFSAGATVELIRRYGVNTLVVVPTMLREIVSYAARHGVQVDELSSVDTVLYGGSPMVRDLRESVARTFRRARLMQAYGMTETASSLTFLCHSNVDTPRLHTAAGLPPSHVELKIETGDAGFAFDEFEAGEILTTGPHVMQSYWNNNHATSSATSWENDTRWFRTGDIGYIDHEGYLFIVGRAKDMVKTGGENVSALEVERAICDHPAVAEASVVGIPDEKFGEAVVAAVVVSSAPSRKHGAVGSAIRQHLSSRIAKFKVPKLVLVVDELPRNSTGKVLKTQVQDLFLRRRARL